MVTYSLQISADELENVKSLRPMNGFSDPNLPYLFKLRCEKCGEESIKESCVFSDVTIPKRRGGSANLIQKCKLCRRKCILSMVTGTSLPLTGGNGEVLNMMVFDSCGLVPDYYCFVGRYWRVETEYGTVFENVDLFEGDWVEYDEKGKCAVCILGLKSRFAVTHLPRYYGLRRWA